MKNEPVTIATYNDPVEANVAKTKLESENIYCFLANEELMVSPSFRSVIGPVELRVKSTDVEEAKQILGLK